MSNSNVRIQIRNNNKETVAKIDRLASQAKTSREDYLRSLLVRHAEGQELMEQRFMYEELVERLTKALEVSNEITEAVVSELRDVKLELEAIRSA